MKKPEFYILGTIVFLLVFFFVIIPAWKYHNEGKKNIKYSELVEIQSKVESVKYTTTGGKHSKPIVYISLENYPQTFRIANSSYKAINKNEVFSHLKKGTFVSVIIRQSELDRSNSNSIVDRALNSLLKWRKQPLIYALSTEDIELLSVEKFNLQESEHNYENIKWGILIVLIAIGRQVWVLYKTENIKRL